MKQRTVPSAVLNLKRAVQSRGSATELFISMPDKPSGYAVRRVAKAPDRHACCGGEDIPGSSFFLYRSAQEYAPSRPCPTHEFHVTFSPLPAITRIEPGLRVALQIQDVFPDFCGLLELE
jgi:hypothetical protein